MIENLIDNFAESALQRWVESGTDWLDRNVARQALAAELTDALSKVDDLERARRLKNVCPIEGASDEAYLSRVVDIHGRSALLEARFKGLNPEEAFVELRAFEGSLDTSMIEGGRRAASEIYRPLRPKTLRVLQHSSEAQPRGVEVLADLVVVAGPSSALVAKKDEVSGSPLKLEKANDLSVYERFTAEYRAFVADNPSLKDELWIPDENTFRGLVEAGQTYNVVIDGRWSGLISAVPESFLGAPGWLMHEELLAAHARGRGLGAVMQQALVEHLHAEQPAVVHGTIHHSNVPSLRTALKVGRQVVAQYFFIGLS